MKFGKLIGAAVTGALLAICSPLALAHNDGKAQHGGIYSTASDLEFELVPAADGSTLYIYDHGKSFAADGISGKLTVLQGKEKSEAELKPAGENRLEAKGVKMARGAKAVASLSLPGKKPVTVRFSQR